MGTASRDSTKQERAQRRLADRKRLQQAAEQMSYPDGWLRWVQARATLHGYSVSNCMLLAHQCHERGISPQRVAGLYAWQKLGRRIRQGETPLRISAPVKLKRPVERSAANTREDNSARKERNGGGQQTGAPSVFFKTAFVFELSQTEPSPGAPQRALNVSYEPLNGNSHAHMIEPLQSFVESLGYSVSFTPIRGSARGWCDTRHRRIAIDSRAPANAQLRALIHECVHALGIDYERYRKSHAEVIADAVTFIASASVGLTVDTECVPYVASWGKDDVVAMITELARTIDELARGIEHVLLEAARRR